MEVMEEDRLTVTGSFTMARSLLAPTPEPEVWFTDSRKEQVMFLRRRMRARTKTAGN